jgi:uncharacterized membrane protein
MEKVNLPVKTRVAAWWMIIVGIIFLIAFCVEVICGAYWLLNPPSRDEAIIIAYILAVALFFLSILSIAIGISFLIPSVYILKGNQRAHKIATIILPSQLVIVLILYFIFDKLSKNLFLYSILIIFFIIIAGVPFILLYLDRKKFRELAS